MDQDFDTLEAEGAPVLGEFFYASDPEEALELGETDGEEKGIWKTILRTGTWRTRPGPGGKVLNRPLHVKLDGPVGRGHVSLKKLVEAFEDGAVEHVTIPLSHQDRPEENTGLVKKLRIVEEGDGKARLEGLHAFSDPEIEKKVENRSILNTSCGILFNHIRKRDAKRYDQALGHVALTNKPWIDGMEPFGQTLAASEQDFETVVGLEMHEDHRGGDIVDPEDKETETPAAVIDPPEVDVEALTALGERLGLSMDELEDRLERTEELERNLRERDVRDRVKQWQADGVPPAVAQEAERYLLADDGGPALLLSDEEGNTSKATVTEVIDAIIEKVPRLTLSERQSDRENSDRPDDDASNEKSHEQQVEDAEAFLEGREPADLTT